MRQLINRLRDGNLQVLEVPPPLMGRGMALVRNHYSLISPGTEGSTVKAAKASLVGKALERPEQVRQAFDILRQQGPMQAYRAVMKKLASYSPLGYSSAGEVIAVAPDVRGIAVGDMVACGGGYAGHAEIVAVPKNLLVRLPAGADMKKAAYNALGAIAMQGVRQADLEIGETCAVIGLGLIGQLTCLILRAGGIKVAGLDIDPRAVEIAAKHCADLVLLSAEDNAAEKIYEFTGGMGVDAVIITASSESAGPVNFAGRILRKKGRVVIVGDVPTGFDREPHFYRKELELRMSCSYGPGRYDTAYEEKGLDYPPAYVRWTEQRNMKAFQEFVHSGRVDIGYLTAHVFPLEQAPEAYDLLLKREGPVFGILIEYDTSERKKPKRIPTGRTAATGKVNIGFIGAGSYATSCLLPALPKDADLALKGIMAATGTSSKSAAERFGFEFCTSDEGEILGGHDINAIFIATRHDTHAHYVKQALASGKNVFVEKPLCTTEEDLEEITSLYGKRAEGAGAPVLMVGFNRRFSPLIRQLRETLGGGAMAMLYRVNAGHVPAESWVQDIELGGGRVIGEVCHFIDLLTHINGSPPERVFASALRGPSTEDTLSISLSFANGSIGTISYFANGPKSLPKEYIEFYRAGLAAVIKDFRELEVYRSGRSPKKRRLLAQDKGQAGMLAETVEAMKRGGPSPISYAEIYSTTLTTFKVLESLRTGVPVGIDGA